MGAREDYAKEAYQDGKAAARAGEGSNPYPWGCHEFTAWNLGYETGQDLEAQRRLDRVMEGAA